MLHLGPPQVEAAVAAEASVLYIASQCSYARSVSESVSRFRVSVETDSGGGFRNMLRKRQFGYRLLHRVREEKEEEKERGRRSSGEPSGGEGVRNDFNAARSRPPEAGAANRHVSGPSRAGPQCC